MFRVKFAKATVSFPTIPLTEPVPYARSHESVVLLRVVLSSLPKVLWMLQVSDLQSDENTQVFAEPVSINMYIGCALLPNFMVEK